MYNLKIFPLNWSNNDKILSKQMGVKRRDMVSPCCLNLAKSGNLKNKRINAAIIKCKHNIPYSTKSILRIMHKAE